MDRLEALHEDTILNQPENEAQNPAEETNNHPASALFSSLYVMHVVLVMVVFKVTQFTTSDVSFF